MTLFFENITFVTKCLQFSVKKCPHFLVQKWSSTRLLKFGLRENFSIHADFLRLYFENITFVTKCLQFSVKNVVNFFGSKMTLGKYSNSASGHFIHILKFQIWSSCHWIMNTHDYTESVLYKYRMRMNINDLMTNEFTFSGILQNVPNCSSWIIADPISIGQAGQAGQQWTILRNKK